MTDQPEAPTAESGPPPGAWNDAQVADEMTRVEAEGDRNVRLVEERIDNLRNVADRFDHQGGSRRLAQRARDKADGMETALRLVGSPSTRPGQAGA